jgi:hypothetical protein
MPFAVPFRAIFLICLVYAGAPSAVSAASPPPASSLETLLAKARDASGAPYRYHVVSRSRETEDGHTYDVTTETSGLKYLARKCVRSLCVTGFYFDGERSFNTNFNQTALPLSESVDGLQLTLRAIASYAFTAPDFRATGGTLADRDTILRDGRKFRLVGVAPRLGALLDAVIDPESGLVVGVISDVKRLAFEFRDQRKIGPLTLPYAIFLNGSQIERFDDRKIDPQPLTAPPGIVPHLAGETTVAMTRPDAPLVPCTIGGQSVTCLFDTGNSGLAISAELAAKLALDVETGGVVGTHGGAVAGVAKAPPLTVAGGVFPNAFYVVLGGIHASGYDIVLGADAFAHTRTTLDFAKHTVTLAAPPAIAGATSTPFEFDDFVPNLEVQLGPTPVTLALDTGDASTVEIASDYAQTHVVAANATTVRVGNVRLDGAKPTPTTRLVTPDRGVLGSGFFSHFVTTFDYAHERITLVPRPGDAAAKGTP